MDNDITQTAISLMNRYIPVNTVLTIETINTTFCFKYVIRLQYTSARSGRRICTTAKGNILPETEDDLMRFYLRQLVIPIHDINREFSRIAWREKRARQEMWLSTGRVRKKDNSGDQIGISEKLGLKDLMSFEDTAREGVLK